MCETFKQPRVFIKLKNPIVPVQIDIHRLLRHNISRCISSHAIIPIILCNCNGVLADASYQQLKLSFMFMTGGLINRETDKYWNILCKKKNYLTILVMATRLNITGLVRIRKFLPVRFDTPNLTRVFRDCTIRREFPGRRNVMNSHFHPFVFVLEQSMNNFAMNK